MPFAGISQPSAMPPEAIAEAQSQADFDGPLVDYQAKGHKVELAGTETVDGKDAYRLAITLKSGSMRYIYVDRATFLEVRSDAVRHIRGALVESDTRSDDYRSVEGLMFPFTIRSGFKGAPEMERMTVEKIEVNVPMESTRFTMPAASKPPGP
jgi:hypothetical protein